VEITVFSANTPSTDRGTDSSNFMAKVSQVGKWVRYAKGGGNWVRANKKISKSDTDREKRKLDIGRVSGKWQL
jgi:hypothetical protein